MAEKLDYYELLGVPRDVDAAELKKFAAASQPAVRKLIEDNLGAEGKDMLGAMLAEIEKAQK